MSTEPPLPLLLVAAGGAGAFGALVISGSGSRLGDPDRCEGLGFGCDVDQLSATVMVVAVCWALLVGAAVVARLVPIHRFGVLAAGVAVAFAGTFLLWSSLVVTYPVPGLTVAEGRMQAVRILTALRAAAGPGDAARAPETVPGPPGSGPQVDVAPTLADTLVALEPTPAIVCRDRKERDMGSVRFEWSRDVNVVVATAPSLTVPSADQVERAVGALKALGLSVPTPKSNQYGDAASVFVDGAVLPGPPARKAGDGELARDFVVALSTHTAVLDSDPTRSDVDLSVRIATPCLR